MFGNLLPVGPLPVPPIVLLILLLAFVSLAAGIALALFLRDEESGGEIEALDNPGSDQQPGDQQAEPSTEESPVNDGDIPSGNVLDEPSERQKSALAPGYVQEDPENHEHLQLNQTFTREYFVSGWPENFKAGFMEDFFTQSGLNIDVSISIDPVEKTNALPELKEAIGQLRADKDRLQEAGQYEAAEDKDRILKEHQTLRNAVRDRGKRMVDAGFYLTVEAPSKDALDDVSDEVEETLEDKGFTLTLKKKDQEDTHRSVSPISVDEIQMKRSMADEHIAAMFPFVGSTILQEGGIPLGENAQNRTPIIYDRFTHGNGYNWLTIGNIGAGKSFSTKTHHVRRRARDDDTILIWLDPLEGFAGPTEALNGNHILVGGSRGLNPLEIEPVPEDVLEENPQLDPGSAKLKDLKSFFESLWEMRGGDDGLGELWNTLESDIRDAYLEKGIDLNDPSTFHKENPTIRDNLIPVLLNHVVDVQSNSAIHDLLSGRDDYDIQDIIDTEGMETAFEEERRRAVKLLLAMQPFAEGGAMDHLGGESEINIKDEDIVWLDLQLQEGRDTLGLMMKLLFSSVYERAKTTDKNVIFAIDEAKYIMEDKSALSFLETRTRHSRHHNLSIQLITQTVDEFFVHEDAAKAIADNCAHKLIFKTEGLTDDHASKIGMNPRQAAFARNAKEGDKERGYSEGVLGISGRGWTPIHISASDTEAAIVDWEPGQPASELPGMGEIDEIPEAVEHLTKQLQRQYQQNVQARVHKERGIPEVTIHTDEGEEVTYVDREQLFDEDGNVVDLAEELGIEVENIETPTPKPDGGTDPSETTDT
jgi:hypothetical protein